MTPEQRIAIREVLKNWRLNDPIPESEWN